MSSFYNVTGIHNDGKAELQIGLKENAFTLRSNASLIEFCKKDGTILSVSSPDLDALKTDASYEYPWLYAPTAFVANTLVAYGDRKNKAIATNLLVDNVVTYDRTNDPTGSVANGKIPMFAGGSTIRPSVVDASTLASLESPGPTGTLAMFGTPGKLTNSNITTEQFAKKIDGGTSLAHYGIADAYTKIEVDGIVQGAKDHADADIAQVLEKIKDSMHYRGTVASFSALTPQMQEIGNIYTVLAAGGADVAGCKIYARDNVCYTTAGWINVSGSGKFDTTEQFDTLPTTDKTILGAIEEVFTSASDGKTLLAQTITGKGVVTESTATYEIMSNNIKNIQTPTESKTVTPTAAGFNVVPAPGKHLSMVTVEGDADLIPANVKAGANIFGVTGSASVVDTSNATAVASQILTGITAYAKGGLLTGTMPNLGIQKVAASQVTADGTQYVEFLTNTNGYHASGFGIRGTYSAVASALNITAEKVLAGTALCGVAGVATTDANATAAQILSGRTAYVGGVKITGTIPSKASAVYTPGRVDQLISSGQYLSGNQVIHGDANLSTGNIKSGVTIFGVAGNTNVVDTTSGTATASQILSGAKAWVKGSQITGTIPSKAVTTYTPSTSNQTIPAGTYLSGIQTILGDADLVSGNIKSGVNIFGVAGKASVVDTSDATLRLSSKLLAGNTAYSAGVKYSGTMENRGTSFDMASQITKTPLLTPGAYYLELKTNTTGYHESGYRLRAYEGDVADVFGLTSSKLLVGNQVFGITGTATSDANATAAQILSGRTAYVNGVKITGTIPSLATKSYLPTTKNISLGSRKYLSGEQLIYGDARLISENIKEGQSIFGVPGACPSVEYGATSNSVIYLKNSPTRTRLTGNISITSNLGARKSIQGTQNLNILGCIGMDGRYYMVYDDGVVRSFDREGRPSTIYYPRESQTARTKVSAICPHPVSVPIPSKPSMAWGTKTGVACTRYGSQAWFTAISEIDALSASTDKFCAVRGSMCTLLDANSGEIYYRYIDGDLQAAFAAGDRLVISRTNRLMTIMEISSKRIIYSGSHQHAAEVKKVAVAHDGTFALGSTDGMLSFRTAEGGMVANCMYDSAVFEDMKYDELGNFYLLWRNAATNAVRLDRFFSGSALSSPSSSLGMAMFSDTLTISNNLEVVVGVGERSIDYYTQRFSFSYVGENV